VLDTILILDLHTTEASRIVTYRLLCIVCVLQATVVNWYHLCLAVLHYVYYRVQWRDSNE